MDLTQGVVDYYHYYDAHRDRSLEPLLEGIAKAGKCIDESMFMLRPQNTDSIIIINLPQEKIRKETLWVTSHFVPTNSQRLHRIQADAEEMD
jgi:hypothetical protein